VAHTIKHKVQQSIYNNLEKVKTAKKNFNPKLAKEAVKFGIKETVKTVAGPGKFKLGGKIVKETFKKVAPKAYKKVKDKAIDVSNKITTKAKAILKTRADNKVIKKANKAKVNANKVKNKNKADNKLNKMKKESGLNTKPFNRKKYDGKPMGARNKVFTQIGIGLGVSELVRQGLKEKTSTSMTGTKGSGYGGDIPNTVDKKNIPSHLTKAKKNPKITYNKPVAGKDFPNYNNSTGGNYGHQGSGTQKDDEMYHKSQTQMNAARKSMGQGSYNFTKKRKK
tara:strand:+ start:176 stop:1015 length:840 start_codon:yes stop_codon:yes gene_type:complete